MKLMMGFQHVVLMIGRIIDWMVPDIPEEVEIKIKREHYMAKEALAENQVTFISPFILIIIIFSMLIPHSF